MHIGGETSVSHPPLRQVFVPVAGHDAPSGSDPRMSLGGTHTSSELVPTVITSQVYGGSSVSRSGQSAALEHVAVQPSPPAPQNPMPLGHSSAVAHGRSMATQTFADPASEHANPAGQSAPVEHACVQCVLVGVPMQYWRHGDPVDVSQPIVPVSSSRQTLPEQICPSAQSRSRVQLFVQKRGALGVQCPEEHSPSEAQPSRYPFVPTGVSGVVVVSVGAPLSVVVEVSSGAPLSVVGGPSFGGVVVSASPVGASPMGASSVPPSTPSHRPATHCPFEGQSMLA